MRHIVPLIALACMLALTLTACDSGLAPDTTAPELVAGDALSKTVRIDLCHYDMVTGTYSMKSVPAGGGAEAAHRGHGDGQVGDAVPGMPGYVFDASCVPIQVQTETILVVAYTDVNPGDGDAFVEGTDVLIAKLVDVDDSGTPSIGDKVVLGQYPLTRDLSSGFGSFLVPEYPVLEVCNSQSNFVEVEVAPWPTDSRPDGSLRFQWAAFSGTDKFLAGQAFFSDCEPASFNSALFLQDGPTSDILSASLPFADFLLSDSASDSGAGVDAEGDGAYVDITIALP